MYWTDDLSRTRGEPPELTAGLTDLARLAALALATTDALIFVSEQSELRLAASSTAEVEVTPALRSICQAVLDSREPAVVLESSSIERIHAVPWPHQFCAAVPILSEAGEAIGVICVVDCRARPEIKQRCRRVLEMCASQARAHLALISRHAAADAARELRLRALFEAMAEGVVLLDHSGAVVTCNTAAERILNLSSSTIARHSAITPPVVPLVRLDGTPLPDDERPAAQVLRSGGSVTDFVMGLRQSGGETRWISANTAAIQLPHDPKPVGAVVTFRDITERVRMSETVASSERTFRALFDSLPIGICVAHERTILYVNCALVRTLGYEVATELIGHQTTTLFHHNSEQSIAEPYSSAATGSYPEPGIIECVRRDGQSVIVDVASVPGTYEGKAATITIVHDVTERDRSARALGRSEARFRTLIALAPVGIFETDLAGQCLYVNESWSRMTELDSEASLGRRWLEAVHPDDRQTLFATLNSGGTNSAQSPRRLRLISLTGKETFVSLYAASLVDEGGDPSGYLGALVDFSEQHAAEQALLASESNFRTLLQRAPIGIGVRVGSTIAYANPATLRMHGCSSEAELLGRNALAVTSPDSRASLERRWEALARGDSVPPLIIKSDRADGSYCELEVDSINIEFGGQPAIMSLMRDVTELRRAHLERDQAHEALLSSLAQKVTLLKEVHHRVKNNLQVIASLLRLGREYVGDLKSLDVFNDSIARVHSIALIHEHLYQTENLDRIDLPAYLSGLVNELRRANSSSLLVEAVVTGDPVRLDLDRCVPIGLIVNELVTNAFKHAFGVGGKSRSAVAVSFREHGADYELCVSDNGRGMRKVSSSQGSLGLLLVESLVRQLQGTSSLSSGDGTCWVVRFPKATPDESAATEL